MGLLNEARRRARHVIGPVLSLAIIGYFAYHAVHGERGLIALLQINQQIREANVTAGLLAARRGHLESRVALLRPDNLDTDMLEERARLMLGLVGENEVVILDRL